MVITDIGGGAQIGIGSDAILQGFTGAVMMINL